MSSEDILPFLLTYTDYGDLIRQRDMVSNEMEALGTIVLTANMDVQILMADMVQKKKRAIARIDASVGGQMFLNELLETAPVNELPVIVNRIKTGASITVLRGKVNTELTVFQNHLQLMGVVGKQYNVLVWKFLSKQQKLLKDKNKFDNDVSYVDEINLFATTVICEEITLLQTVIQNQPARG